jgi:hypothetical protein
MWRTGAVVVAVVAEAMATAVVASVAATMVVVATTSTTATTKRAKVDTATAILHVAATTLDPLHVLSVRSV